jgi:hypothetical protein
VSILDDLRLCFNFLLKILQSSFMLCLLQFSLLLKLEFFSTLPLGKSSFLLAFFAWERCLMALPRLKMPLKTPLLDDLLATKLGVADKGGRVAF